jgi:hypothetical protein
MLRAAKTQTDATVLVFSKIFGPHREKLKLDCRILPNDNGLIRTARVMPLGQCILVQHPTAYEIGQWAYLEL